MCIFGVEKKNSMIKARKIIITVSYKLVIVKDMW